MDADGHATDLDNPAEATASEAELETEKIKNRTSLRSPMS
jgi:hypothetical protein